LPSIGRDVAVPVYGVVEADLDTVDGSNETFFDIICCCSELYTFATFAVTTGVILSGVDSTIEEEKLPSIGRDVAVPVYGVVEANLDTVDESNETFFDIICCCSELSTDRC